MIRRCAAAGLGVFLLSATAWGDAPLPTSYPAAHHPRLFLGFGGGAGSSTVSVAGKRTDEKPSERFTAEVGYSHPLYRSFLAGLFLVRAGNADTTWSEGHGETRTAFDLSLGPEFRYESRPVRANVQWRLAVPVGYTHAWFTHPRGRAVQESFGEGNGFHLGAIVGVDASGTHSGAYANLEYTARIFEIRHDATAPAQGLSATETWTVVDHSVVVICGFLFRP